MYAALNPPAECGRRVRSALHCATLLRAVVVARQVVLGLPYNQKVDVWSLGCILAELFTSNARAPPPPPPTSTSHFPL